jgi:tetratricopeptide (TPR) repeat protein
VHADALEALVQRACGNPLYLEQLVHAVQVSGALVVGSDGEYELDDTSAEAEHIPPTVAAAVSARLSHLKPPVQRTLTAAAVFGEVFWAEGISKLGGQGIESVMLDLDQLLLLNLVRRRSFSRYKGQTELEFTHAVVRSVALSRLKRPRRLRFEVAAATYLESVGELDQAVIARHFAQGRLHRRAAELYAPAAERALALGDVESAGILAEEGLRAAEGGAPIEARIRLLGLSEQVAVACGDWEAGREALDATADLADSPQEQAELLLRRSRLAAAVHRYEEARVEAQEAERAFGALDLAAEVARSHLYGAEASEAIGDGRAALRGYLSALVGLGRGGASVDLARSSRGLARIAVASGDYKNAENRFRSALVSSRAARDYMGTFLAHTGLADVGRTIGDIEGATAHLEDALLVGFDQEQRLTVRVRQVALLDAQERHDEAQAQFLSLLPNTAGRGLAAVRRKAILGLGQTFRRRANQDALLKSRPDVLEEASQLLAAAQQEALTDDPALLSALQLGAAVVEALRGNAEQARALVNSAQDHFQTEGALAGDEPPAVYYTVARVAQMTGDSEDVVTNALSKAVGQLDNICTRLDTKGRAKYLERPISRAILDAAQECGVPMPRALATPPRKRSRR